jgi:hypothetical protein
MRSTFENSCFWTDLEMNVNGDPEGINAFMTSPYFRRSESESVFRMVIDMLFCDRLNNLDNNNSDRKMNWTTGSRV